MKTFNIPMKITGWHYVKVEAETLEDAIDQAALEGLPGIMMLNHEYPDTGDGWEIDEEGLEDMRQEDES